MDYQFGCIAHCSIGGVFIGSEKKTWIDYSAHLLLSLLRASQLESMIFSIWYKNLRPYPTLYRINIERSLILNTVRSVDNNFFLNGVPKSVQDCKSKFPYCSKRWNAKFYSTVSTGVLKLLVANGSCRNANWWTSFDKIGWSKCPATSPYINGLYRSRASRPNRDYIYLLQQAKCCGNGYYAECVQVNWVASFDR